jgi:hypothetical protein
MENCGIQHSGFHSVVEYSKVLFPIYWSESHSYLYLQLCLWLNLTCFAGTGKIVKTKNLDKAMHDLVFKCSRRLLLAQGGGNLWCMVSLLNKAIKV